MLCLRILVEEPRDWLALRQTFANSSVIAVPLFDARIFVRAEEFQVPTVAPPLPYLYLCSYPGAYMP